MLLAAMPGAGSEIILRARAILIDPLALAYRWSPGSGIRLTALVHRHRNDDEERGSWRGFAPSNHPINGGAVDY